MTNLQEPVVIRFRGHERTLPLAAFALSFGRATDRTATSLEFLIQGPPERRPASTADDSIPLPTSHGEGVGGGARSERSETSGPGAIGSETSGSETLKEDLDERSGPQRSERERRVRETDDVDDTTFARRIASDLGDEENVGAIRKLVASYPRPLLGQALHRTLGVPADRIRSSRGAIFTGIVRKLAADAHQPTP